jgi:hypothetical protein
MWLNSVARSTLRTSTFSAPQPRRHQPIYARPYTSRPRAATEDKRFNFLLRQSCCIPLIHGLPIYDSLVARFFLFEAPSSDRPVEERITKLTAFHDFLGTEYARVIKGGQLASAIAAFRQRFNPQQHTDEKIIDWLIWTLVSLADRGALLKSQIVYE